MELLPIDFRDFYVSRILSWIFGTERFGKKGKLNIANMSTLPLLPAGFCDSKPDSTKVVLELRTYKI